MTLSGSAAAAVYYIICRFTGSSLSTGARYNILKAAAVLFVFPFPWLKYLLPVPSGAVTGLRTAGVPEAAGGQVPQGAGWLTAAWILTAVSGALGIGAVLTQLHRYRRIKRLCTGRGAAFVIRDYVEDYEALKAKTGVRRKIRFVFSDGCATPMTIGLLSPIVIFPEAMKERGREEWVFLLSHELNHIKAWDFFTLFLGRVVCWAHFFNPAAHFLYRELRSLCEIHCDDRTTADYDADTRADYCRCLVKWARNPQKGAAALGFSWGKPPKIIKRRVLEIKRPKERKRLASLVAALAIGIACGVSVLAYEPAGEIPFFLLHDLGYRALTQGLTVIHIQGGISEDVLTEKVVCFHTFEPVVLASGEGRETRYYDGMQCSKCGTLKLTSKNTMQGE